MSIIIVPNYVSDLIYKRVDEFKDKNKQVEESREEIYQAMLRIWYEIGVVPELKLPD